MLLLALLLSSPSFASPVVVDAIYRGRPVSAKGQAWKSTVGLQLENSKGKWFGCSGVFIASDLILTAAHCAKGITKESTIYVKLYHENSNMAVTLAPLPGEFRMVGNPRYRKVSAEDPGTDDVAVLVLKNIDLPTDFAPAEIQTTLQAEASSPGMIATVVGAGMTEKNEMSDRLYFVQGMISDYIEGDVEVIDFGGNTGTCGGDSGGPVFVTQGSRLYLSALVTAGTTDLNSECASVLYANAITMDRYNWVQSTAARLRNALEAPAR